MMARNDDPWGGRSSTAVLEVLVIIEGGLDSDADSDGPARGGSEAGAGDEAVERKLLVDCASADGSNTWASVTDILRRLRGPSGPTDGLSIEKPRFSKTLRTALRRLGLFGFGVCGAELPGETSSLPVWEASTGLSTIASGLKVACDGVIACPLFFPFTHQVPIHSPKFDLSPLPASARPFPSRVCISLVDRVSGSDIEATCCAPWDVDASAVDDDLTASGFARASGVERSSGTLCERETTSSIASDSDSDKD